MGKKDKKSKVLELPVEVSIDLAEAAESQEAQPSGGKKKKGKDKAAKKEKAKREKAEREKIDAPEFRPVKFAVDTEIDSSDYNPEEDDDPETIHRALDDLGFIPRYERSTEYAYKMSVVRACLTSKLSAQKLRIQISNRLVATIYARLGYRSGEKIEDSMFKEAQILRAKMMEEFSTVSAALTNPTRRALVKALVKDGSGTIFTNEFEVALCVAYNDLLRAEKEHEALIKHAVIGIPIWDQYLKDIKGCSETMAATIASMIDIYKSDRISSLWKYCGLDVVINPDTGVGVARSKRKEHQVTVEYINKDGDPDTKQSLTYKPILKSKLLFILGKALIKSMNPTYKPIYDNYKFRKLSQMPEDLPGRGIWAHNMAVRYMVKMFLQDLWLAWRKIEGLPICPSYAEAKLGLVHGGYPESKPVQPVQTPVVQQEPEPVAKDLVPEYLKKAE